MPGPAYICGFTARPGEHFTERHIHEIQSNSAVENTESDEEPSSSKRAWICFHSFGQPGWSLPGIRTLTIRKHKSSKNKLVVCCSLHETQQRDQNRDFKTPDWKEFCLSLGWIVRYIKDLLSLLFIQLAVLQGKIFGCYLNKRLYF